MNAAAELSAAAPPDWSGYTLATVLPSVAASLCVDSAGPGPLLPLDPVRRAVVVLVDGLGFDLLTARSGHAPFLRSLLGTGRRLHAGFPPTTATSMGTFGTGLPPGAHGLAGFEVLDPQTDRVLNELSWENGPDPLRWQPHPTIFEKVTAAGIPATRIGPGFFDGSGLTNAALRGGRFVAARTLEDRCVAAASALGESDRALVYLYWGEVDKVGHVHGCQSWQWGEELTAVDSALQMLADLVPAGTAIHVTADHGMVDVPHADRIDLAYEPELRRGVRHVAGEPRSIQLHVEPGALGDVRDSWAARLGPGAWLATRDELVAAGWFGAVRAEVLPRLGDLFAILPPGLAVVDSATQRAQYVSLIGWHGSVTPAETGIPLLTVPAA